MFVSNSKNLISIKQNQKIRKKYIYCTVFMPVSGFTCFEVFSNNCWQEFSRSGIFKKKKKKKNWALDVSNTNQKRLWIKDFIFIHLK